MKIGILTQPLQNNYGGLLQNYALQQVLKGMGHEVETVDWSPEKAGIIHEWLWQKKESLLFLLQRDRVRPHYQLTKEEETIIGRNTHHFIERYIKLCSKKSHKIEDFEKVDEVYAYDAYVVGSDQVWRPSYNSSLLPAMFLSFTNRENLKRVAYAASFGVSDWEFDPLQTDNYSSLVKRFNLITVREKSGVDLCRNFFGVDATWVLDPTMLLCREDYEAIVAEDKESKSEGGLFHYILNPSKEINSFIEHVATDIGTIPFTIMPKCQAENRTKWDVKHRIEDCVFPSVTSWLRGFMDSEMVVVDSFHGAVFSIIFNKPFWVIGNKKRGNARFESLLGLFGLEDRMIDPQEPINLNRRIDWDKVNSIRQKERERCMKLLKEAL